jgi:DNA-binding NarL/FixJ family response regulator
MTILERDEQLASLHACVDRARSGQGCTVIVAGEPGIGKSTLLRLFASNPGQGIRILWGVCDALSTPRPLGPLQDVASSLGGRIPELLETPQNQSALFGALLQAIEESNSVTVFVIEDLHWADAATLDLVRYLGRRLPFLKAVLLLTVRSEELRPDHPAIAALADLPPSDTRRMDLPPLTPEAVAQLAAAAGRDTKDLHEVTRGNPFFVTELLQAGAQSETKLPRSVRDAVWARLQRLTEDQRAMLEIMSLIPGGAETWLLEATCGPQALALADSCCERGVLTKGGNETYVFRHELARLAALESVAETRRRSGHGRILSVLRGHDGVSVSRLVHHAEAAGDSAAILDLAPRAAHEAAALGAHQQAAVHLALALRHSEGAPKPLRAQLLEDWSYEAGLSQALDDEVAAARTQAIALWRELGRRDKVGINLRWLSRLYWYRGESTKADSYLAEAVSELEASGPGPELAMAYSLRSQFHMLHDRMTEACEWGQRAIALAKQFGARETLCHALNNVGSALLFGGDEAGKAYMEESLALSLAHGFHEQAARAYTNYAEYAVITKQFDLAERLLNEGIPFDTEHDLESWTYYLIGRQAQLRLEQGRLQEARIIAEGVLARAGQTRLMKLPARLMLGRALLRMGAAEARDHIAQAYEDALAVGEQQYLSTALLTMIEEAWTESEFERARSNLRKLAELRVAAFDPWERGEVCVWWQRLMPDSERPAGWGPVARPRELELQGKAAEAAEAWLKLGVPFDAALALMHDAAAPAKSLARACEILQAMGARPLVQMSEQRLLALGQKIRLPATRRGPYAKARMNPMGLTAREQQVLELITAGKSNQDISQALSRSPRTVEHHVSAVLAKFNARSRLDLVLRLRQEPWLLGGEEPYARKMGAATDARH